MLVVFQRFPDPTSYSTEELLRDHASFVQPSPAASGTSGGAAPPHQAQARVAALEDEVARLRAQLGRAKSVNDTMWETVVQQLVAEKGPGTDGAPSANGAQVDGLANASPDASRIGKRARTST